MRRETASSTFLLLATLLMVGSSSSSVKGLVEGLLPFSPYPLWSTSLGYPASTPVIGPSNMLFVAPYFGSTANRHSPSYSIAAIDAGNGNHMWSGNTSFPSTADQPKGTVGVTESVAAVVFKDDTEVNAFDISTGKLLWRIATIPLGGHCVSISGSYDETRPSDQQLNRFYVALRDRLLCLNATNGKLLWHYDYPYSDTDLEVKPFSLYENRLLVGVIQGKAVGIDAVNGGALWSTSGKSYSDWTVSFYGHAALSKSTGLVAVQGLATNSQLTSNNATVAGLNANNGQTLAQAIFPGDSISNSGAGVSASGAVVMNPYLQTQGFQDTYISALNATASSSPDQPIWQASYLWYVSSVVCDSQQCFASAVPHISDYTAKLYAFDAMTGSIAWKVPSPFDNQENPIIVNQQSSGMTVLYGSSGEYSSGSSGSITAYVVRQN